MGPVGQVPEGYVVHRVGETWLVLDRDRARELVPLRLADPVARRAVFARAPRRGRGHAPSLTLAPGLSVVLRRYRHGGLFGGLLGTLFLGPGRPLSELSVTARAGAAGAPVPHVLCLAVWRVAGPFWSGLIGTREILHASDLSAALAEVGDAAQRRHLIRAVGLAVRRLHDAGVDHRDLQLRNILVAHGEPRISVVDLDAARFDTGQLSARRRARNLGRLARSAVKLGSVAPQAERRELALLLGAYTRGDRALRRALRRFAAWERLKLALHRSSYVVRGVRSPWREASPPRPA